MGLSISTQINCSYSAILSNDEEYEPVYDETYKVIPKYFPRALDGLGLTATDLAKPYLWFTLERKDSALRAGYSGYNTLRSLISKAVTGRSPEWYWERIDKSVGLWVDNIAPKGMPEDPYDIPFMDIIQFSDCEGIIAGEALTRLHNSLVDAKTLVNENGQTGYQRLVRMINEHPIESQYSEQQIGRYDQFERSVERVVNEPSPALLFM